MILARRAPIVVHEITIIALKLFVRNRSTICSKSNTKIFIETAEIDGFWYIYGFRETRLFCKISVFVFILIIHSILNHCNNLAQRNSCLAHGITYSAVYTKS